MCQDGGTYIADVGVFCQDNGTCERINAYTCMCPGGINGPSCKQNLSFRDYAIIIYSDWM